MIGNIDIKSSEEGCFTRPNSVCIDSAGNFIVADANRLQVNKCFYYSIFVTSGYETEHTVDYKKA